MKLSDCKSSDDLARYLHTLGWRAPLDRDWDKLQTLWLEILEAQTKKVKTK